MRQLTWAIPEPIRPAPTTVTCLITSFLAAAVEARRTKGRVAKAMAKHTLFCKEEEEAAAGASLALEAAEDGRASADKSSAMLPTPEGRASYPLLPFAFSQEGGGWLG